MNNKISRRSFTKNAVVAAGVTALAGASALAGGSKALAYGSSYMDLYCAAMDSRGLVYDIIDDYTVKVPFAGDNTDEIDVYVIFDENGGNDVALRVWSIYLYDEADLALGYAACNQMNNDYRWVSFCVDSDNEIAAKLDTLVCEACCGDELVDLVYQMVDIVDIGILVFDPAAAPAATPAPTPAPDPAPSTSGTSPLGKLFGA